MKPGLLTYQLTLKDILWGLGPDIGWQTDPFLL